MRVSASALSIGATTPSGGPAASGTAGSTIDVSGRMVIHSPEALKKERRGHLLSAQRWLIVTSA